MARFRFTLQPVLDMREREEQTQQRVVAEIQHQRVELERQIRSYHAQIEDERTALREQLVGETDFAGARLQANATVFLTHQADACVVELAGVYARLDRAKQDLAHATGRRRAIESLRDRQRAAWQAAAMKREQHELDEIASTGYSMPNRSRLEAQR